MSYENEHLNKRISRYDINTKAASFTTTLKGLAIIVLNITELCTRKCSFCPRTNPEIYPNQNIHMTKETAFLISEKCKLDGYTGDIHISGFGEPLLNRNILELLTNIRVNLPNNHIILTSNGDRMTIDYMKSLYSSGVNYISISCYEEPLYAKFEKMFADCDVPQENFKIRKLWFIENENTSEFVERNTFHNAGGTLPGDNDKVKNNPCYFPFYKMMVDWNGDVLLCCEDWLRKAGTFGNLTRDSLSEVWHGQKFNEIRMGLLNKNRACNNACKNCSINGLLMGYDSVKVLESIL
jgi:MoaA/NifB/PqqE/SkfB family radical SAM enzyme